MTLEQIQFVPTAQLPEHARVWQYISDRALTETETLAITSKAKAFCAKWTAHNHQLHADAWVAYNQILVLVVDETHAGASGCSIDKSTHFVEEMGAELGMDFFVRDRVFYQNAQQLGVTSLNQLKNAVESGEISLETPIFDTTASSYGAYLNAWKPLGSTWMKRWV
jgi:hypothetical protein